MKGSAQIALSYVRATVVNWGIDQKTFEKQDVHIHLPSGAIPKDGPSAGVALAIALLSLFTGRPAREGVAVTGEITLRGKGLQVREVLDQVLAARRVGIDTVVVPARNAVDLTDLPAVVQEQMNFVIADRLSDIFHNILLEGAEQRAA